MHNLDFQATTYPNGKFESQTMCNEDKTDGYRVRWYESGKIKSAAEYKYGKLDGLYTEWYEDGTKSSEINYFDGVKHGVIILWHENSQVKLKSQYKYGNLNGLHTAWHKNGQIKFTANYRDGKRILDTNFTAWHANGNKSVEINYLNGHRHDVCTIWHKDGSKRSEVAYVNGKMDGLWVLWYKTGQIHRAVLFKDHRKTSETTWYGNGGIKYSAEYGPSRRYQDFSNIYIYKPDFNCPILGRDSQISAKRYWATSWSLRYENGQKSAEHLYYGYEDSVIQWHENGQKSFEVGKKKGDPNIHWDKQGVKECESKYYFNDTSKDCHYSYQLKIFDNNEQHLVTVEQVTYFDEFNEWEFFDKDNNKIYNYRYDHTTGVLLTSDELWNLWLNSESKEFVKILKSVEKHKSTICII